MDILYAFLISVSLCFDSFALCVTAGLILKQFLLKRALIIAFAFATPQALMFVLGWLGGTIVEEFISSFDHWVAFGILCIIGGRMVHEGLKGNSTREAEEESKLDPRRIGVVLALGFAASFDAVAVGISVGLLNETILLPAIVLFFTTLAVAFSGVYFGGRFASIPNHRIFIIGGIILIAIGIRILVADLFFPLP